MGASRRVLIVDDHEDLAVWIGDKIRALGHEVAIAYDGPSALALADEFQPDIVVLDIAMPGMNGWEVARRLRAGCRQPRLIAISALCDDAHQARSLAAGFEMHLRKPLKLAELAELL
jgi:two-component system, OmpR family, response regulator